MKLWSPDFPENPVFEHTFNDSVTCCDFYPYVNENGEYLIAIGFESGMISMLYISKSDKDLHLQKKEDIPEKYINSI